MCHVNNLEKLDAAVLALAAASPEKKLATPEIVGSLAEMSRLLIAAGEKSAGLRVTSLRDLLYHLRGRLPSQDSRILQQINAAYGLLRHCSDDQLRARVVRIAAQLTGEVNSVADGHSDISDPMVPAAAFADGASEVRRSTDVPRVPRLVRPHLWQ